MQKTKCDPVLQCRKDIHDHEVLAEEECDCLVSNWGHRRNSVP